MTQDDYLQKASATGPWILLREQQQEIQEIRELLRRLMTTTEGGDTRQGSDSSQEVLFESLKRRIDSIANSSQSMTPFVVKYPEIEIYLADSAKVDRLNEDERMAGIWLAICTLFLGAWLQTWMESNSAGAIGLLSAAAFGLAAGYQYWRARKALTEMHNTKWRPLIPGKLPQDAAQEKDDETKG